MVLAYRCEGLSVPPQLLLSEIDRPEPGPGDLLVRVAATGVGYVDALICSGRYQIKPALPFTPCGEIAGEVVAVGSGVDDITPGTRVLALAMGGGLAEYAVVRARTALVIPPGLESAVAAGCCTNYCTTLMALDEIGRASAGETIVVAGAAGGLGMAAIDVARARGLRVVALCAGEVKSRVAIDQGAEFSIDYREPDWRAQVERRIGSGAVDIVFDPIGGELAETAFRMLAPRGRYLVLGFASGDVPRLPLNLPLLKRASLLGVDWGGELRADPDRFARDARTMMSGLANGAFRPAKLNLIAFGEAENLFDDLLSRRSVGKNVVVTSSAGRTSDRI